MPTYPNQFAVPAPGYPYSRTGVLNNLNANQNNDPALNNLPENYGGYAEEQYLLSGLVPGQAITVSVAQIAPVTEAWRPYLVIFDNPTDYNDYALWRNFEAADHGSLAWTIPAGVTTARVSVLYYNVASVADFHYAFSITGPGGPVGGPQCRYRALP